MNLAPFQGANLLTHLPEVFASLRPPATICQPFGLIYFLSFKTATSAPMSQLIDASGFCTRSSNPRLSVNPKNECLGSAGFCHPIDHCDQQQVSAGLQTAEVYFGRIRKAPHI